MRKSVNRFGVVLALIVALSVVALPGRTFAGPANANALSPDTTITLSGTVYRDLNGDGVRGLTEPVVAGAQVQLFQDSDGDGQIDGNEALIGEHITDHQGFYVFTGLASGTYVLRVLPPTGQGDPYQTPLSLSAANATIFEVNVGVLPASGLTLSGIVYKDLNGDGVRGLGEPVLAGAQMQLFQDSDGDGQVDAGEALIAQTTTDIQGFYVFTGLSSGTFVLRAVPPAGQGDPTQVPLLLVVGPGATIFEVNVGVPPATASASVSGKVWSDLDGDEQIDADPAEPGLANVKLSLVSDANGNRQADPGEPVQGPVLTDAAGSYRFGNLAAGAYLLQVDAATTPVGWMASTDPSILAFTLAAGEDLIVNIGYYDPMAVAPLRVGEWKKEFKQAGKPRYTPQELSGFVTTANANSAVFDEIETIEHALNGPAPTTEAKARKQHAALWLNRASNRLLPQTPVNLPGLTTATTVAQATSEIEGILAPPGRQTNETYRRAEQIAEALNSGRGIGYGASGVAGISRATYKGKDVTTPLKPGGGVVDATLADGAVTLSKWSPGALDPATNVFSPKVRVKVQAFYDGGVLEVMQRLSNGSYASLGVLTPTVWNKDVKATYVVDVWRVATLSELVSTEFLLVVRDPANDGGHMEHVKIDSAELIFDY